MSPAADQKARVERRFSGASEPSGAAGFRRGAPGDPAAGLAALRAQVRRIEQGRGAGRVRPVAPLGLAALDEALPGGGLPLGALHEIEGERAEWDDGATTGFCLALLSRMEKAAPTARPILWVSRPGDPSPPTIDRKSAGEG